jgi:hypothetical protein
MDSTWRGEFVDEAKKSPASFRGTYLSAKVLATQLPRGSDDRPGALDFAQSVLYVR